MTFEERIDALTARHEALTQTVELIGMMQVASEQRIEKLAENGEKIDRRLVQIMEAVNRLANIAEAHEHRLDRIEGVA